MRNFVRVMFVAAIAAALGGCFNLASKPSEISAAYVPAAQYESYSCHELEVESQHLARRKNALVMAQKQRRQSSKVQAFWLGFGDGDGVEASELAYVKGGISAVQKQMALKSCQASS